MKMDGQTAPTPDFPLVAILFFVYCLSVLFLMNTLWSLLDILFSQKWVPFLLIFCESLLENFPSGVKILYRWMNFDYQTWLPGGHQNIWIATVLTALIVLAGFWYAPRREVFHA
jgi:hypothetical protein